MTHVQVVTTTVYVIAGRRFLKKRSAYLALARRAIRKAYRCSCEAEVGFVCGVHTDAMVAHIADVELRLARWLQWHDERGFRSSRRTKPAPP